MRLEPLASRLCATFVTAGILVFACVPTVVTAASPQEDESRLIAKVKADGTLFGFAQTCNVPKEDVKRLFNLNLASTREFFQTKVPHYTPDQFKADFRSGIEIAQSFANNTDPDSEPYKRNCSEIRQKVASLLQGK